MKHISEFNKNVAVLTSGTALAQAIPLLFSPLLTRLFTPEQFGELGLFMAASTTCAVLSTGRYELAIMIPKKDKEAKWLMRLAFYFVLMTALFISSVAPVIQSKISWLGNREWVLLLGASVFVLGSAQTLHLWLSRQKKFKVIAAARTSEAIIIALLSLFFGYYYQWGFGLIVAIFVGQLVSASIMLGASWNEVISMVKERWPGVARLRVTAKKFRDFPRINGVHQVFDLLQRQGLAFIITPFFGTAVLGLYSTAFKSLRAPLAAIGASFAPVFYQEAAKTVNEGKSAEPIFKSVVSKLFVLAVPMFGVVYFFGEEIFAFVFGEEWGEAGFYAEIMAPWLFFNFLASPVSQFPLVANRQKTYLWFSVIGNTGAVLVLFVALVFSMTFTLPLKLFSGAMLIFTVAVLLWNYSLTKKPIEK